MDGKELLKAMGFEHQQESYHSQIDGEDVLITSHMLTHDNVPGLFLAGKTLGHAAKNAVECIKTLTMLNDRDHVWFPFETAPTDGTEVIFWVSSVKGFQDTCANFFYVSEEMSQKYPNVYAVHGWYWSESEEPLKRPDLVKGWKRYPEPPVKFSNNEKSDG